MDRTGEGKLEKNLVYLFYTMAQQEESQSRSCCRPEDPDGLPR